MPHSERDTHLRLVWPQWQGAGTSSVEAFAPEFPFDVARRGYATGTAVLEAVLPPHHGPTATAPVTMSDYGLEQRDGVEAKQVVLDQLAGAFEVIREHAPARITTLGGECSVSIAPFAELAHRYGDDLAIVWIDAHPDIGTPNSEYKGYHAMAVATLTGHGDPDVQNLLPATISPDKIALVGLHSWTEDDFPNVAEWGIETFVPDQLRESTRPLLDWITATGCSRVAIHFDVDAIDSEEIVLGLGVEPGGLTSSEVQRISADITSNSEVVGTTIAEFIPRQVIQLQQLLKSFPLLG
ncbi:arginase family protein [Saccharopolyspora mangrovi]|uniref:Arginase family protein n=1 Tax=Saccharopolyspora mangrovi TaxID=3082379 RepID=A0ABU6AJW7_9PSEU|nr:arginase family protein [Saccharopolyspora sp. S2-29]MEB3371728.1 arginase family protein [Saccharopolyspora sp. S2-29]